MTKSTAIIGGGAAGMICMATLVQNDYSGQIFLFEKNKKLGAKVAITGGGRCNVTTGYTRKQDVIPAYIRGAKRLLTSYKKFSSKQVYKRFEDNGCRLKVEEDMRVFPISNNSKDVIGVFERFAEKTDLHLGEGVTDISRTDTGYTVTTHDGSYDVQNVVICVGGNAYRHTGSTGDGYTRAEKLGHEITTLGPSLNSFLTQETRIHECTGLSFPHAGFVYKEEKILGPMLCTHFGLSGPLTFVLAAHSAFESITATEPLTVKRIPDNTKTSSDREEVLVKASHEHPQKRIRNILGLSLPKKLCEIIDKEFFERELSKPIGPMSKETRKAVSDLLGEGISLTLIGRRAGDEFVTAGGVITDNINPKTMESTISPGLYFAGEVLNIDGVTGGYNLQVAWSTGRAAGEGIGKKIK